MNDIFAVQEEIARAVTGALKVKLLGERPRHQRRARIPKPTTPICWGDTSFGFPPKENLEKAVGYFEQAIKLDPGYALAWVGLGESRSAQAAAGYIPVKDGYPMAREALERALGLDADLGEAHCAIGWIKMFHDWDWVGAGKSFQRALALEPGDANAMRGAGSLAWYLGRWNDAIALYRQAIEIDRLHARAYRIQGINLHYAGRQDDAIAALDKALEFGPEMAFAHCLLGQVYLMQSHPQEALAEAEKEKHPAYRLLGLALAYHALGQKRESDASLKELIATQTDAPYQIAEVYAYRGDVDRSFAWLERAYTERDPGMTEMKGDPLLTSLRRDPRYAALLQKMRLPL